MSVDKIKTTISVPLESYWREYKEQNLPAAILCGMVDYFFSTTLPKWKPEILEKYSRQELLTIWGNEEALKYVR